MEVDADLLKKKRQARLKFRGAIRALIANKLWLEDNRPGVGLRVKNRVEAIIRRKRTQEIVTVADKLLINKPYWARTDAEKRKLAVFFVNLQCFRRLSPKARASAARCSRYVTYGAGRIILKEGDPPVGMYFILNGEVIVSKKEWDHVTKSYVDRNISVLGPGDVFGEYGLINNTTRPVTTTTASEVELLVIYNDEFTDIVKKEMKLLWDNKREIFSYLKYFDSWNISQKYMGCKLSTLNEYSPLQTIYSEDNGILDPVFFVVSGKCMILQNLKMKVKTINGRKVYSLVEHKNAEEQADDTVATLYELFQERKEKLKREEERKKAIEEEKERELIGMDESDDKLNETPILLEPSASKRLLKKKVYCDVKIQSRRFVSAYDLTLTMSEESMHDSTASLMVTPSLFQRMEDDNNESDSKIISSNSSIQKITNIAADKSTDDSSEHSSEKTEHSEQLIERELAPSIIKRNESNYVYIEPIEKASVKYKSSVSDEFEEEIEDEHSIATRSTTTRNKVDLAAISFYSGGSMNVSESTKPKSSLKAGFSAVHFAEKSESSSELLEENEEDETTHIENHFVDVGTLSSGAIFGLGENMHHRAILAKTTVQCLLLPRYWLFEKSQNPGDMWQRIRFHLNANIPSREALFKDFLATKKWNKFKDNVIEMSLDSKIKENHPTKIEEIPIICRIVEGIDK